MNNTEQIFTEIYKNNTWSSQESASGVGSELYNTTDIREQLPVLFEKYDIKRVLDIGCGDFNWMKTIVGGLDKYLGIDTVQPLIDVNNSNYGSDKITFHRSDLEALSPEDFVGFDAVISKDVFVHLSLETTRKIIANIRLGSIQYFFSTSFLGLGKNIDIPNGLWRPVNLLNTPFNLWKPIETIISYHDSYNLDGSIGFDKTLSMWRIPILTTGHHNAFVNNFVYKQLKMINPSTAVDVGTGDGFWGKVLKILFPTCHVTGVELSPVMYDNSFSQNIYDSMINDTAFNGILQCKGDVVIFGDILEHLEKDNALSVVKKAEKRYKWIIINTPVGFQPQETDDPCAKHRCGLFKSDFEEFDVVEYHESVATTEEYSVFNILIKGTYNGN